MAEQDIELSRRDKFSFEAKFKEKLSVVHDTILDNVVTKFSLVNDHHVRGKWRIGLSISVIVVPITAFAVILWYQVMKACVANCAYYPLLKAGSQTDNNTVYSTENTIRDFLAQESIYYCASIVAVSEINTDGGVGTEWYPCTIRNHDFDGSGTCSTYQDLEKIVNDYNGNGNCFSEDFLSKGSNVAVFYTQCIPIATALVTAIQAALYSVFATIVLYLMLRIVTKYGIVGLFSPSKWTEMLNNGKKDWKELEDNN